MSCFCSLLAVDGQALAALPIPQLCRVAQRLERCLYRRLARVALHVVTPGPGFQEARDVADGRDLALVPLAVLVDTPSVVSPAIRAERYQRRGVTAASVIAHEAVVALFPRHGVRLAYV